MFPAGQDEEEEERKKKEEEERGRAAGRLTETSFDEMLRAFVEERLASRRFRGQLQPLYDELDAQVKEMLEGDGHKRQVDASITEGIKSLNEQVKSGFLTRLERRGYSRESVEGFISDGDLSHRVEREVSESLSMAEINEFEQESKRKRQAEEAHRIASTGQGAGTSVGVSFEISIRQVQDEMADKLVADPHLSKTAIEKRFDPKMNLFDPSLDSFVAHAQTYDQRLAVARMSWRVQQERREQGPSSEEQKLWRERGTRMDELAAQGLLVTDWKVQRYQSILERETASAYASEDFRKLSSTDAARELTQRVKKAAAEDVLGEEGRKAGLPPDRRSFSKHDLEILSKALDKSGSSMIDFHAVDVKALREYEQLHPPVQDRTPPPAHPLGALIPKDTSLPKLPSSDVPPPPPGMAVPAPANASGMRSSVSVASPGK